MIPHNPIEHVVIIVKENHSFDNYLRQHAIQLWYPRGVSRYQLLLPARNC
jgi:hypothetical protein